MNDFPSSRPLRHRVTSSLVLATALAGAAIHLAAPISAQSLVRDFSTVAIDHSSNPQPFTVIGDATGDEPWTAPLQPTGVASTHAHGDALCAGTFGLAPSASANGLPQHGNAAFAIDLGNARAASLAVLALSLAPADLPLDTCRVLVLPPIVMAGALVTDAVGFCRTPFPIPANTGLIGFAAYCQYAVLDPSGPLLGAFAASNGIAVLVGS